MTSAPSAHLILTPQLSFSCFCIFCFPSSFCTNIWICVSISVGGLGREHEAQAGVLLAWRRAMGAGARVQRAAQALSEPVRYGEGVAFTMRSDNDACCRVKCPSQQQNLNPKKKRRSAPLIRKWGGRSGSLARFRFRLGKGGKSRPMMTTMLLGMVLGMWMYLRAASILIEIKGWGRSKRRSGRSIPQRSARAAHRISNKQQLVHSFVRAPLGLLNFDPRSKLSDGARGVPPAALPPPSFRFRLVHARVCTRPSTAAHSSPHASCVLPLWWSLLHGLAQTDLATTTRSPCRILGASAGSARGAPPARSKPRTIV